MPFSARRQTLRELNEYLELVWRAFLERDAEPINDTIVHNTFGVRAFRYKSIRGTFELRNPDCVSFNVVSEDLSAPINHNWTNGVLAKWLMEYTE